MSASPATGSFSVTPHDTNPLPQRARALWVGGAGDVALKHTPSGDTVTFYGCQAGSVLPVEAAHVLATGTSATNIRGLL